MSKHHSRGTKMNEKVITNLETKPEKPPEPKTVQVGSRIYREIPITFAAMNKKNMEES